MPRAPSTPWARRRGEPAPAYEAFTAYLEMGADRTLDAVAAKAGRLPSAVASWSTRWEWVLRSECYDTHLFVTAQAARDREIARQAAVWERRRLTLAEETFNDAAIVRQRARQMLRRPIVRETVEEDGKTIVIYPAKWTFATASNMLKGGTDLAEKAIDLASGCDDDDFDPLTSTPEECKAWLERQAARKRAILEQWSKAK